MQRYKKKELLEKIKELEVKNKYLENIYPETIISLQDELAKCQSIAIDIGNYLETLNEIEGNPVGILEEYCEDLYQQLLQLEDEKKYRQITKKIDSEISRLYDIISRYLNEDKKEIIFLPYKASMWDAMESIWKAANQDDNCDTFVIPIPYYQKNPDGSFGKMYYEGEKYPDYVPITSWEEYNISNRRPDIIYIHNPYDNCNYVTSVHQKFYGKELKKYTDKLVYIPYFVTVGDNLEESLCLLPGILYSDLVIVQSEYIKKKYIEIIRKFEIQNNCISSFGDLNKKILPLGSPKFDSLTNLSNNFQLIPDSWKKLIIRQDGSLKTVIFYNTSLVGILNKKEIMIKKIRSVFSALESEKDVVLLWRPHPLLKSTIQTLCPELLEEYIQIEEEYRFKKWGIFDETPDLSKSISISDFYYGDASSVVELFLYLGKPILLQNTDWMGFGVELYYIFLIGMTYFKNSIYSLQVDRNAIIKIDTEDGSLHYYGTIPGKSINKWRSYHYSAIVNDKMFLVPFMENDLVIFDFEKSLYNSYELKLNEDLIVNNMGNFYNFCLYKNKIFLFPFAYRGIISYDFENKKTSHHVLLDEFFSREEAMLFSRYEYVDETKVLLPCLSSNKVLLFNLENYENEIFNIGEEDYKFSAIFKYKNDFWMLVKNRLKVLKWNLETGQVEEFSDFPKGCKESSKTCFDDKSVTLFGEYLYCFPARSNMAIKINLEDGSITKNFAFDKYCSFNDLEEGISIFDGGVVENDNIYLHYQKNSILKYNFVTDEIFEYKRELSNSPKEWKQMEKDYIQGLISWKKNLLENTESDLLDNKENIGMKIHKSLME